MIRRLILNASSVIMADDCIANDNHHNHGMVSGIGCLRTSKKRSNKVHNSAAHKIPTRSCVPAGATSGNQASNVTQTSGEFIPLLSATEIAHNNSSATPTVTETAKAHSAVETEEQQPQHEPEPTKEKWLQSANEAPAPEPGLLIEPDVIFPSGNPLLGSEEMDKYLPKRQVIVQVTTWNMGSLPLPHENQMAKLFGHETALEFVSQIDVHVIGIQECWPDVETWELVLQTALGNGYALFHSLSFGTLHLSVFIRRDLLWFTTEPTDFTQSVRTGRIFKTKGCTGVQFGLFGSRLLFINAHLSAGNQESYAAQRVDELRKILATCEKAKDHSDAVFLFGDLNFRVFGLKYEEIIESLNQNNILPLLENDQLNHIFRRKDTLPHFLEPFHEAAAITFRPTYKYDVGRDNFDSSTKQRAPAYTDRIIYKSKILPNGNANVCCIEYEGVFDMRVSDHRPVYGIFSIELRPGFDTLALSGARFKRDLYVKAIQNQAKFLLERRKKLASTVCTIC